MEDFFTFVNKEIKQRGWDYSELARRGDISASLVSLVMGGSRDVTFNFCLGVAKALRLRPEEVLRRAGLLPPLDVGNFEEMREIMGDLSPEEREQVFQYARWRRQIEKERGEKDKKPGNAGELDPAEGQA